MKHCELHGPWPMFETRCIECATASMPSDNIICPFCGRDNYDKSGLKGHLSDCEAMEAVEVTRLHRFW